MVLMPLPIVSQLGALGPQVPQSGIVQQLLSQTASPPVGGLDPMLMSLLLGQQQASPDGRSSPSGPVGPTESFQANGLSQELLDSLPKWWNPKTVTWQGATLHPRAMRSFQRASDILGSPIDVTGTFRTLQDQQRLYADKPDLAAPPGHSFHQTGLAFDLNMDAYPEGSSKYKKLVRVLERLGWHRFDPGLEPWHFSFKVTG